MRRGRVLVCVGAVVLVAAALALPFAGAKPLALGVQVSSGPSQSTTATTAQFTLSVQGAPTVVQCKQETGVGDTFSKSGALADAPAGGPWQVDRGGLSAFSVAGGDGRASVAGSDEQLAFVALSSDFDVSAKLGFAAGASANTRAVLVGRVQPGTARYLAGLAITAKGALQLQVQLNTGAGTTTLGNPVTLQAKFQAASRYYVRFQGIGSALRAKAWRVGALEPGWQITVNDNSVESGVGVGFGAMSTDGGGTVVVDDFVGTDPAASGVFADCVSGSAQYGGLGVGGHVFTARAATSREAQVAIYPWTISPPAPTVTLSSQPTSPTTDTSAAFAWTTSGVVDGTVCTLDGASAPCTSPTSYSGLALGSHSFIVTVSNVSGSNTATVNWTINPPAPTVTISAQPTNPTTDPDATFEWMTTGVVDSTVCTLDGVSAPCTSPRSYPGLALGTHSFSVTIANVSGSDTATVAWTINPPPPGVLLFPNAGEPGADATFTWSTTGIVESTTCTLDGVTNPCTSPKSYFGLEPGLHAFTVTVTNVSGSNSSSLVFTVAGTPPTVALTSHPADPTTETSASFEWTTTGFVGETSCTLDGVTTGCMSPRTYTGLATGSHSFTVTVSNVAGSNSETFTWTITSPPVSVPLIPLAVADTKIGRAQLRVYNYCSTSSPTLLATANLKPLADEYQTVAGMTLWAPDLVGSGEGQPAGITLSVPDGSACEPSYLPIGVEMRVAAEAAPGIDLTSTTCAQLAAMQYADCWSRLTEFRGYHSGNPDSEPRIGAVSMSGGTCSPDPLFSRTPSCTANVSVEIDWGSRGDGPLNVPANFSVSLNGQTLNPPAGSPTGVWTSATPLTVGGQSGANQLVVAYQWRDTNPSHAWGGLQCRAGGGNPCQVSATVPVQRSFAADDANAGTVELVRMSLTGQAPGGAVGDPLMGLELDSATVLTLYATVGLRNVPDEGDLSYLGVAGGQGNQVVRCDPNYAAGEEFQVFKNGCGPLYSPNAFTDGIWWNIATRQCPQLDFIFAQPNSPATPWRCVGISPGMSAGSVPDAAAVRTGNCQVIGANSCQLITCINPSAYPTVNSGDPRLVRVLVVPYGATKGLTGSGETMPVTATRMFYITGWGGTSTSRDPCPGADPAGPGEIVGHFVQP
jgi:hypothetical protein